MKWEDIEAVPYTLPEEILKLVPKWIRDLDETIFLSDNYLVLDFETTTIDKGNPHLEENQLVLAGWWYGGKYKEHYGHEFDQDGLIRDIESCDFVVCHNSKFELGWLRRLGVPCENLPVWCTQVGEYTIRGNRTTLGVSLDATGKRHNLQQNKIKLIEKLWAIGLETYEIPQTLLSTYCQRDVELARDIFERQRSIIIASGMLKVMYVKCWLPLVLMDVESRGMCLDEHRVSRIFDKQIKLYTRLISSINNITDYRINLDSPDQIREYLYETLKVATPSRFGRPWTTRPSDPNCCTPSVSLDAIKSLKPRTKKAKEFIKLYLNYKKVNGEFTKYLDKFLDCCNDANCILTANLNQTVTTTHRLSSNGRNYKCQFQNFNREFKPLFRARNNNWVFRERDYSQLEFAVAVELGRDITGYEDITKGADLHSNTATEIFLEFKGLTGEDRSRVRTKAKSRTFKPLFGGTSGTQSERRYYDYFKKRYNGIADMQGKWIKECLDNKQFRHPINNLIWYFPWCKVTQSGYIKENEKIRNINIQSVASSDIVLTGLVLLWHCIRASNLQSFICNTVHDSIETEEHPEERYILEKFSSWALLDGVYWVFDRLYNYQWKVPLKVDEHASVHWGDSEEWRERWLKDER